MGPTRRSRRGKSESLTKVSSTWGPKMKNRKKLIHQVNYRNFLLAWTKPQAAYNRESERFRFNKKERGHIKNMNRANVRNKN